MKNFIFLLACLLACSTLTNAQLKVDSIGRSYFGERPEEVYEKMVDATATIYGKRNSALNLYSDIGGLMYTYDSGAPYFIQCIYGNTNVLPEVIYNNSKQLFHRVFYVDYKGMVYAKGGTIQPAVDPKVVGTTISPQNALSTSALDRLVGIKGVSYTEESNTVQSARMSGNGSSVSGNKRL